jgi:hypothetical protein
MRDVKNRDLGDAAVRKEIERAATRSGRMWFALFLVAAAIVVMVGALLVVSRLAP